MRRAGPVALGLLVAAVVGGCTSAPPGAAPALTVPATTASVATTVPVATQLLAEGRQWAFRVRSVACLATGSSFELTGGIVTNRHVAAGSTTLQMANWEGNDFSASVTATSAGPDLALLAGSGIPTGSAPAVLAGSDPAAGTPVWAVGYPEGGQLTVTAGTVVGLVSGAGFDLPGQVLEITNQVEPGNSGSALVDASGQVVGVVFARQVADGEGLAIPVSALQTFLTDPGTQVLPTCVDDNS